MPAALKVVVAVNIVCAIAIILLALSAGGGFVSGVFPPDEGHEIKLVPIQLEAMAGPGAPIRIAQRAEIPPEYRTPDPAPSPWVAMPDGTMRFSRND